MRFDEIDGRQIKRGSGIGEMSDSFERKVISPAEREARKAFKEADAVKALTEHERAQKAFHENRERLKALRLARAAAQSDR